MFGIDNVDITLSGKSTPTTASCFGTANQAPGTILQATLHPDRRLITADVSNMTPI
jgi:hypothetical protein